MLYRKLWIKNYMTENWYLIIPISIRFPLSFYDEFGRNSVLLVEDPVWLLLILILWSHSLYLWCPLDKSGWALRTNQPSKLHCPCFLVYCPVPWTRQGPWKNMWPHVNISFFQRVMGLLDSMHLSFMANGNAV